MLYELAYSPISCKKVVSVDLLRQLYEILIILPSLGVAFRNKDLQRAV